MVEVVCEVGINASGDLCIAKKLIDIASSAGCHYVKFQKRNINLVYTKEELDKPRESKWGKTTREQKEGLEFSKIDYIEIALYCAQKGIQWFASPWDVDSAAMLGGFDVPFIKIPSALITNKDLLDVCRQIGKPIIISTGMSTILEVDEAIDVIGANNIYCIMHCTSTYPTDPWEINIKMIPRLKELYPWCKIGFSNHYPGLMAMIMAATMGAEMLEMHVTMDRSSYGSDQAASIEPSGVFGLIDRLKLIDKMIGDGQKRVYDSEIPILKKLRRNS